MPNDDEFEIPFFDDLKRISFEVNILRCFRLKDEGMLKRGGLKTEKDLKRKIVCNSLFNIDRNIAKIPKIESQIKTNRRIISKILQDCEEKAGILRSENRKKNKLINELKDIIKEDIEIVEENKGVLVE
jgi:hypothetical protein